MDMLSYCDIVKKTLNNNIQNNFVGRIKYINPLIRLQTQYTNDVKLLLRKLFKNNHDNLKILKQILKVVISTKNNKENIIRSMIKINNILEINSVKKYVDDAKHEWIANNIYDLIQKYGINDNGHIVDIGGGEGNILSTFNKTYNISKNDLICVEQQNVWDEQYNYTKNTNYFNYIFWDNKIIDIPDKSVDICIIMVTMHHMTDNILQNLFINLNRVLKDNGIVIIKEHDCMSNHTANIINWEHHLYHILMSSNDDLTYDKLSSYVDNFVGNYKSRTYYDNMFTKNGFIIVDELDRSFNEPIIKDLKNVTKLYWKIYRHVIQK
jgi:ubiquinone/menaquinone biosynthesis C-methylase UbiE